jgi:hypothetical protein
MEVSPMTLNSKGEESEDPEGEVSTLATALEMVYLLRWVGQLFRCYL